MIRPAKRTALMLTIHSGLLFGACHNEHRPELLRVPLVVDAFSDEDLRLAGVAISIDGKPFGTTDEHGRLLGELTGSQDDERLVSAECPSGFRAQGDAAPTRVRLRDLAATQCSGANLEVRCTRVTRLAALLVMAPGMSGLPILVDGTEVARTDTHGTAHLTLSGTPESSLRVVLDTRERPRLTPASPHQDVVLSARDEIVMFAPRLAELPLRKR
jgi:hypothetical protein